MSNNADVVLVVADTGPMLCAGGEAGNAATGIRMFNTRLAGRLWLPRVVHEELANQIRRNDPVGEAARQTIKANTGGALFRVDNSDFKRRERQRLHDRLDAIEVKRKGLRAKVKDHYGEVDAILLAKRTGAVLLSNDRAAVELAIEENLVVGTYANLLRSEVEDGRLTADDAFEACQRLTDDDIDHGLDEMRPLALLALDVLPGL